MSLLNKKILLKNYNYLLRINKFYKLIQEIKQKKNKYKLNNQNEMAVGVFKTIIK